jgi:hypothetical protein
VKQTAAIFPLTLTLSPKGERGKYLVYPVDKYGLITTILKPRGLFTGLMQ